MAAARYPLLMARPLREELLFCGFPYLNIRYNDGIGEEQIPHREDAIFHRLSTTLKSDGKNDMNYTIVMLYLVFLIIY